MMLVGLLLLLCILLLSATTGDHHRRAWSSSLFAFASSSSSSSVPVDDTGVCEDDDDYKDHPMMKPFPTPQDPNYKAYVRPDISSYYQQDDGTMEELPPLYHGLAGKFVNISPMKLRLYWDPDDGRAGSYISDIGPWAAGGTGTFPTHKFYFANANDPNEIICRFQVQTGNSVHYFDPYISKDNDEYGKVLGQISSRGEYDEDKYLKPLSTLSTSDRQLYDAHRFNLDFGAKYKNFTGGSEWLSFYPREAPRHKVWRADYFGQEHIVETKETHFVKLPPSDHLKKIKLSKRNDDEALPYKEYRTPDASSMKLSIKAVSCHPRAFEIKNFLSDVEVDHMLDIVKTKNLARSTTGGVGVGSASVSSTRTSRTTWLPRSDSPILDAVYRRAADALRIDEALFRYRGNTGEVVNGYNDTNGEINEHIQIVNYQKGQQYTPHHDFGYPDATKKQNAVRSINIAMYLNGDIEGGETWFPRARQGVVDRDVDGGIKVKPEKGKAMIFYMINPDGNLDDLSHHAGAPVGSGEKWFSNLWIWDPFR